MNSGKILFSILLIFLFHYSPAKTIADSSKKIHPFIKMEAGIGATNIIYKPFNSNNSAEYLSYSFNILGGVKIKDYSVSSGIGILTLGYKITHLFSESVAPIVPY